MGCGQSAPSNEDTGATAVSRQIERDLAKEQQIRRSTITIFLAGAGESGKSTVLKQLRFKYSESDPYDQAERMEYISIILSNTVQSMVVLLDAVSDLGLDFSPEANQWADEIYGLPAMVDSLDRPVIDALFALWQEKPVQAAFREAAKFQLNDSASYFFDNLHRITDPDFFPTNDDILRARVRTTGIIETRFKVGNKFYKVIDVGGQRSERRKWISAFEGVDCLLFLFSTSEFDQVLREDETMNRLVEAETLFESISNSQWFKDSTLIVFLNKIDLFAAKIAHTPLSAHLPEYKGPNTVEASLAYMKDRVLGLHRSRKEVWCHYTCATDTRGIDVVLTAVNEQLVNTLLRDAQLI